MRYTAREVRTNSKVMNSCGLLHMNVQRQDDQLEPIYNSSADTGCSPEDMPEAMDDREGGEKGSGISVLMVWFGFFV